MKKKEYYTTKKQREKNKALCKQYPFLIPRSGWADKVIWERKAYDWTLADDFPVGWWKAFGLDLCQDMRKELERCHFLKSFRIVEIKEKFGELRIYTGPLPIDCNVMQIVDEYAALSQNICMICGKPDIPLTNINSWFKPYCRECFERIKKRVHWNISYEKAIEKEENPTMPDEIVYYSYSEGKDTRQVVDLSEKTKRIRTRWEAAHGN